MHAKLVHTRENCVRCGNVVTFSWPVPKPDNWRLPVEYCKSCRSANRAKHQPTEWGGSPPAPRVQPVPEAKAADVLSPNEMHSYLCAQLGIPGSLSFKEAVAWLRVKVRPDHKRACPSCGDIVATFVFTTSHPNGPGYYCSRCNIKEPTDAD